MEPNQPSSKSKKNRNAPARNEKILKLFSNYNSEKTEPPPGNDFLIIGRTLVLEQKGIICYRADEALESGRFLFACGGGIRSGTCSRVSVTGRVCQVKTR